MKNQLFISACLKHISYSREVVQQIYDCLLPYEVEVKEIENHRNNVWCRDYMPVMNAKGEWVQFRYYPQYMIQDKKYLAQIPDNQAIKTELKSLGIEVVPSNIILDGGAIEILDKKAIVSDRVFRDNKEYRETELLFLLKNQLKVDQLIIIPQHPYDMTGHVDGLVRFVDEKTVVINDLHEEIREAKEMISANTNRYRGKLIEQWYYSFLMSLYNAELTVEILPCNVHKNQTDLDGNGIYINFLLLDNLILMPYYDNEDNFNQKAKESLERLYKKEAVGIYCSQLAKEGGMINCVTWQT